MDTRRTILWVVFSASLLLLWDSWQRYNGKPSLLFGLTASKSAPAPVAPPGPVAANSDVPTASAMVSAPAAVPAGVPVQATVSTPGVGQRVVIQTDLFKVDLASIGAEVQKVELLAHHDGPKNMVLLDLSPERTYMAQSGLVGGPAGVSLPNHRTAFTVAPGPLSLVEGQNELSVIFSAESGGVKLVKTYTFKRGSYEIAVRHEVINVSQASVTPQLYLQLVRDGNDPPGGSSFYSTFTGTAVYTEAEKFQKQLFSEIEKNKTKHAAKANDGWIAIVQHYFVSAWLPEENMAREIYTERVANNLYRVGVKLVLPQINAGSKYTENARLFVGPQEERLLEKVAPGLELVRDYGWLTILAKPLFWLLEKLHGLLGNWGWAIVALTVMLKLVFFPLSAASYKSMARMKKVAPRLKVLQEKHKGDRAKMNQAMMEMYRAEKINPLGGCLPMLVQIPVFIALYWTLLASVEMRNAPWIGWIHDLAVPDPFFILPVIMMVSMLIQYKLNPAPPDPVQAKLMLFMPLIFGVMFFFFPAGLVLYWVVNNILSIAQQWQITRLIERGTGNEKAA